jgi:leucyl-tRNA synthetase
MSKSKGNVVDPDQLITQYGADTVRLFSLFAAPPERDLEWNAQGVEGANRFLNRVYRYIIEFSEQIAFSPEPVNEIAADIALSRKMHQTIKKVSYDIENDFHFNTAISAIMELFNMLSTRDLKSTDSDADTATISEALRAMLILLYPMVPHFSAEMWHLSGFEASPETQAWPEYDEEKAREEELVIVLQVNGKVRSKIQVAADIDDDKLQELALADEKVLRFTGDKPIKKVIVVQKKLVNIVV